MSQLTLRESDEFQDTSSDNELESNMISNPLQSQIFARRLIKSQDSVDRRFLDIYRIRNQLPPGHLKNQEAAQ